MKLINQLRNATEQGKETVERALEQARESGRNLERHLRQKMRIYPRSLQPPSATPDSRTPGTVAIGEEEEVIRAESEFQERKPIISIHGKDIKPGGGQDRRKQKINPDKKIA